MRSSSYRFTDGMRVLMSAASDSPGNEMRLKLPVSSTVSPHTAEGWFNSMYLLKTCKSASDAFLGRTVTFFRLSDITDE